MLGAGAAPLDAVRVLQPMIDVSAGRLDGLRTHCATSAEITQQEIRTLEGKLIKLFSRQLVIKAKFTEKDMPSELRNVPSLSQWLQVVGLGQESIKMVCSKVQCVESLQEKSERELKILLGNAREEEHRRLCRAIHNLKKYMEILMRGGGSGGAAEPDMPLWWDSWDHHHLLRGSPRTYNRHMRASVPSEDALLHLPNGTTSGGCASLSHQYLMSPPNLPNRNSSSGKSVLPLPLSRSASSIAPQQTACTPPPSPHSPNIFLTTSISIQNTKGKAGTKFPTTPPANRKHQIGLTPPTNNDVPPLTKSKSHESQLGIKIDGDDETEIIHNQGPDTPGHGRSRLATESGVPSSPLAPCSPIRSPPYRSIQSNIQYAQQPIESDDSLKSSNLTVPRSPRTPVSRGMCHLIAHRFTKTFKMMATCDYCEKQMFLGAGLRCKECKYKCHRDCETKVPPSCGLPPEFVDEFKRKLQVEKLDGAVFPINNSPSSGRSPQHGGGILWNRTRKKTQNHQLNANVPIFAGGPDSSSNTSSCNSSTPSSPALVSTGAMPQTPHTPRTPHNAIALVQPNLPPPGPILTHNRQQFNFPDVKKWPPNETNTGVGSSGVAGTGDSEHTVSLSGSASEDSERTPGGRTDSIDGDALQRNESAKWPRQNSLSMKEWDIPYNELGLGVPVGTGRFGTVYRGNWHGDVAVKFLNMHNVDNKADLESFKLEVATFRKTRHENLVLFMGVCTEPTRLAIITSLCKGMTLYTHIHLRKDKFNMNKTTIVAQQISQGMGYLHARGIIHKDLKSKNIFLENGKVVITDFGLFSVTKLCFGNSSGDSIGIPAGWLCYLAPELVRGLRPQQTHHADDLPFSKASDVYAFGTVWYELLCGEWPFKGQPPEAVIWQVGKGVKQTLANLQASRDVKDILMLCWSYRVSERPDFGRLLSTLEKLPRKRLARSPSHPVHLSRSAESVF